MQQMPEYKDTVSLIPYGLPQFLDFEVPPERTRKIRKTFVERPVLSQANGQKGEAVYLCELQEDPEEGCLLDPDGKGEYPGTDYYVVQADKHLVPWLGQWLPVPFLRQSGDFYGDGLPRFRLGPTNWARAYVTRVPSEEDPEILNWRIVLAFDMQVEEPQNGKHAALSPDDVTARAICSLADKERDNSWFVTEGWVDGWLRELWDAHFLHRENTRHRPLTMDGMPGHLDYLASYLVYLQFLQLAMDNLNVRIVNLAGTQDRASDVPSSETVDVDLVLDIGNSRSTGILVENQPNRTTDLNDSYRLQLRDLSRPELFYSEPFETRVEFSKVHFGSVAYSKRSGRRSNAFSWISPVRTGPEASRLAGMASNAEGISGMTSPKRYLWDQDEASNLWYFNRANTAEREELVSSNSICRFLNNAGTPAGCVRELNSQGTEVPAVKSYLANLFNATLPGCKNQDPLPANQPRFSRSSMMMFLFMELIQQALVTINSPAQRYRRAYPDRPRRLRSIIFTVPPGMAFAEQRIYRRWAYAAVSILWEALGWKKIFFSEPPAGRSGRLRSSDKGGRDFRMNPEIRCRWDEATCTQLVYLYNEINRSYQGDAHLFFETMGRLRTVPVEDAPSRTENRPSLRIATIDLGGGTTDLSITTYILANDRSSTNRIWPKPEIRDGFNLGGDDVLREVVSDIVCKAIVDNLVKQGVQQSTADMVIREMFGKKSDNIRVQNQRIQFLRQVAQPIAYEILKRYEQKSLHDVSSEISISVGALFRGSDEGYPAGMTCLQKSVVDFFNETLQTRCGIAVDVMALELNIRCSEVDKVISTSVRSTLNGMGEVIRAYDCDVLLLTGRPSCWNAVVRQVFAMLPVAPDRIVPLNTYLVGPWYPFASTMGKITDPKTTVVTGAILCALAENSIEGFVFDSSRLELKSTARYIGELDVQGVLPREKVWFPNLNPDKARGEDRYTKIVEFSSPITIGFRQFEVPRWAATRCWRMEFVDEEARRNAQGHTPYEVKVQFVIPEQDENIDDIPEAGRDIKARLDEPQIDYQDPEAVQERRVVGGTMERVRVPGRPVRILLRTLGKKDEEGCWMDTGILF